MPYPYTLMPDGHTLEPDEDQQPTELPSWLASYIYAYVSPTPENDFPPASTASTTPAPNPVTGLAPFDTGPSPYHTPEYTQYGQPPSTEEEAERRRQRIENARQRFKNARRPATNAPPPPVIDEVPDFADLGLIDSEPLPLSDSPDWPGGVPLSQGQNLHADHFLSIEDDTMVREMLIGIKRDGIPPKAFVNDYLSQYAEWGWDDLSSARTLQVLEIIRNSDWDEWLERADSGSVETVAQDQANDWIEGLVIIDAGSRKVVLNKTGVLGPGGQQYVGLQDYEVEALRGLELIFVHNHTNDTGASDDDLNSAFDAGAEMLMVVTSKGYEYVYIRGRNGMVKVRDEKASYEVGPEIPEETEELRIRSEKQARAYQDDSPEYVFRQEEPGFIDRLVNAAKELNLDTALPVSELISLILKKVKEDIRAFGSAAVAFYGYGDANIVGPASDLKDLLDGALPYWKTAEVTGVDPARLAQLVLWEDSARSSNPLETWHFESSYSFFIPKLRPTSFGPAQIQVRTAVDMLTNHPEAFDDFSLLTDGLEEKGNWIPEEVARQLWYNQEFSIRVAGAYLMDFETRLKPYLRQLGVVVSDRHIDEPYISIRELQLLAVVGYNQGWDHALADLQGLYDTEGAREVVDGIRRTLNIQYVHNVLSKKNEALVSYGLLYGEYREEE